MTADRCRRQMFALSSFEGNVLDPGLHSFAQSPIKKQLSRQCLHRLGVAALPILEGLPVAVFLRQAEWAKDHHHGIEFAAAAESPHRQDGKSAAPLLSL